MTVGQPCYPKEEFARRGDEIYELFFHDAKIYLIQAMAYPAGSELRSESCREVPAKGSPIFPTKHHPNRIFR
jgi:hypothetical protein